MVRVTFASVVECTGIRNLHLAIAAPRYSGHESVGCAWLLFAIVAVTLTADKERSQH